MDEDLRFDFCYPSMSLKAPGLLVAHSHPFPLLHQVDPGRKNMKTDHKLVLFNISKCLDNSAVIRTMVATTGQRTESHSPLCPAWSCLWAQCCPLVLGLPPVQAFPEDPPLPETQRNKLKTSKSSF